MALDLVTFILPFLFVLAIVYGALQLAAVFKNRAVNAIIAVVVAFFAISNAGIVATIVAGMPWAAMLFIVLFFLKFIHSFFKVDKTKGETRDYTLLMVILGLIVIFMLSQGTQLIHDWLPGGFPVTEDNLIIIIGIVIIVAIFLVAYRKGGGEGG
jgi:hypothetical protein